MNGYEFLKNCRFDLDDVLYVVRQINPDQSVVTERVETGEVTVFQREALLRSLTLGSLKFHGDSSHEEPKKLYSRPIDELKDSIRKEINRRLEYVSAIREEALSVLTPQSVMPICAVVAERIGDAAPPSFTTLYRWMRAFYQCKTFRILIPRHDRRGPRSLYQPNRVIELFQQAADKAFSESPQATVKAVHDRLSILIKDENSLRPLGQQLKMPSQATTYRLFNRISQYEKTVWREGKGAADRKFTLSGPGAISTRILERVEIDHTPIDVFLVDERTGMPLGRPMLTMLVDHYSRMPLGYHVGFNGASALAVTSAIRHAVLPKIYTINADGLEIISPWPCYGIPQAIIVDNGIEFHGLTLERLAFNFGIRILYCPKREPRFKGVVERYLKTINYSFAHLLPGTSFARFYQRGDYDPEHHAVLTLTQFKNIFEKWMIDEYAHTVHRGLGTTPFEKWTSSARTNPPRLPQNVDRLIEEMGMPLRRSLRHDGIVVYGLHYAGDALATIMRRYGEGVRLTVLVDHADLGKIRVCEPDSNEAVHVAHANEFEYADGLTLEQHKLIKAEVRAQGQAAADSEALYAAKRAIQAYISELIFSKKHSKRRQGARFASKPERSIADNSERCPKHAAPHSAPDALNISLPLERNDRPRLQTFQMRKGAL